MAKKHNPVGWFEIPVKNMKRAVKFYQTLFGVKLELNTMDDFQMAWFPWVKNGEGSAGSLMQHKYYKPSKDGVLIYFITPTGNMEKDLKTAAKAGGKILMPKKSIGEYGFMGLLLDTEGNRIALHSMK